MAPGVDQVLALMDMLRTQSYPAMLRDVAEVKAFALAHGSTEDLSLWDIGDMRYRV